MQQWDTGRSDGPAVLYSIEHNADTCTGCGLCAAFCPMDVYEMRITNNKDSAMREALGAKECAMSREMPYPISPERCVGCKTCEGQCPVGALSIMGSGPEYDPFANREKAPALPQDEQELYIEWAAELKQKLGLELEPVAVTLVSAASPLPDAPVPRERMRYCQQVVRAAHGESIMLPPNRHSCPDGTSILGMTDVPPKLASGEIYLLFKKLHSMKAASQMVAQRPRLPQRSVDATVATPLARAVVTPDVVIVACNAEQAMWITMSASYYSGERFNYRVSGFNSLCVEATLIPVSEEQMNLSLGCYGCRAASDLSDTMLFMGIPRAIMPTILSGLHCLSEKAIPDSRAKIYLPRKRKTLMGEPVERTEDNSRFLIRDAQPSDKDAVSALMQLDGMGLATDWHRATVAVDDCGNLVGYLRVQHTGCGPHVAPIAVHPEWQGQGVGRALIEDALEREGSLKLVSRGATAGFYRSIGCYEIPFDQISDELEEDCRQCVDRETCQPIAFAIQQEACDG